MPLQELIDANKSEIISQLQGLGYIVTLENPVLNSTPKHSVPILDQAQTIIFSASAKNISIQIYLGALSRIANP